MCERLLSFSKGINMAILKKLIRVGGSKAIVIPNSYLSYWKLKGKTINEVGLKINKNIIIEPIFIDIEKDPGQHKKDIHSEIDDIFKKEDVKDGDAS